MTPVLGAPDYLADVSANEDRVSARSALLFIGAVAAAGIAIAMYPVLRQAQRGPGLGSVGFRLIEGRSILGIVVCWLVWWP